MKSSVMNLFDVLESLMDELEELFDKHEEETQQAFFDGYLTATSDMRDIVKLKDEECYKNIVEVVETIIIAIEAFATIDFFQHHNYERKKVLAELVDYLKRTNKSFREEHVNG